MKEYRGMIYVEPLKESKEPQSQLEQLYCCSKELFMMIGKRLEKFYMKVSDCCSMSPLGGLDKGMVFSNSSLNSRVKSLFKEKFFPYGGLTKVQVSSLVSFHFFNEKWSFHFKYRYIYAHMHIHVDLPKLLNR